MNVTSIRVRPSLGTAVYPHMPILRPHAARIYSTNAVNILCFHVPKVGGFGGFDTLNLWGAKFPKMGDSLPRTPMNHRAKFDAASFIPAGHTHTNKQ